MVGSPNDDDHPVEVFKRSTAACVRAMSGEREVEVSYGAETPSVAGERVRLPSVSYTHLTLPTICSV